MLTRINPDMHVSQVSNSLAKAQEDDVFKAGVAALRGEASSLQGLATVMMSRTAAKLTVEQAPLVVNWQAETMLIWGKIGDFLSTANAARAIAAIHLEFGNYEKAVPAAKSAATAFMMSDMTPETCQCMRLQANAALRMGDQDGCMTLVQAAMELAASNKCAPEMATCAEWLADMHEDGDDKRKGYGIAATGYHSAGMMIQYAKVITKLAEHKVMAYMMDMKAWEAATQGEDLDDQNEESMLILQAQEDVERALAELTSGADPCGLANAKYVLGMVEMLRGRLVGAPQHFQAALGCTEWVELYGKKAAQARSFVGRCSLAGGIGINREEQNAKKKQREADRAKRVAIKMEEMRLAEEAEEKELKARRARRQAEAERDVDSDSDDEAEASCSSEVTAPVANEDDTSAEAPVEEEVISKSAQQKEAEAAAKRAQAEQKSRKEAERAQKEQIRLGEKRARDKEQKEERDRVVRGAAATAKREAEEAQGRAAEAKRQTDLAKKAKLEEERRVQGQALAATLSAVASSEDEQLKLKEEAATKKAEQARLAEYRKPLEENAEPRAEAMAAAAAALSGRKASQSEPAKEPESDKERRDRFAALMASKQEDRKKRMNEASRWAKEKKKCEDEKVEEQVGESDPPAAKQMEVEPEPEPEPAASCVRLGECRQGCNLPVWFAEWNEQEQQMELEIMLPGVSSVGELDLDCSEVELEVEGGGYYLQLAFTQQMDDDTIKAKFDAKTSKLGISLRK